MKKIVLIPLVLFIASGCTGTKVKVTPEPDSLKSTYLPSESYLSVGLRDVAADRVYPPAGNMTESFGSEMRQAGFVKDLYYPVRPDDEVDIMLDSKFDVLMDPNMGPSFFKAFLTGLTLFVLEPVFWYHYEYILKGNVIVSKNGERIKTVNAKTNAVMSMKWLSLGQAVTLEGDALGKAKKSLYRQLMEKIQK